MKKIPKRLLIVLGAIILFLVLIIVFISPITKYTIEKYDIKIAGRQVTMDWAYVNPFTGYVHFSNLKIYEYQSDSIFISADGLSANIALFKLPKKVYEISGIVLTKPKVYIVQDRKKFNFTDLIEKFAGDTTAPKPKNTEPTHFSLLDVKVEDGEFHYHEKVIPIKYFIKKLNIVSDEGYRWDNDKVFAKISFIPGIGKGKLNATFTMNVKSKDYGIAAVIEKFDLQFIEQYMKDLANYGNFRANLDANMKVNGNFGQSQNINASGFVGINDFHFGKNPKEDYASFKKIAVQIVKLSPARRVYQFDSVMLHKPYFKYERYDHLDNIQNIFGRKGSNIKSAKADPEKFNLIIEIANYVKDLSKNFLHSNYKVNRLGIYDGNIKYNDYSLNEKFGIALNPFSIYADSIEKSNDRVNISLKSGIKPYGVAVIDLSINPKDSSDFNLDYDFTKIPITIFNPYTITYTSYPLDRGTIEFKGKWDVKDGAIKSENHLLIVDPRTTTRVKNKDSKWLPTPLIMAFVRENSNAIDYQIPVTGDLKNPKFNFEDVIFDVLKNIFIKPVTIPYRVEVKSVESKLEESISIKWAMRSSVIKPKQTSFTSDIAEFLKQNPKALIQVHPKLYMAKEKEYILLFEGKKKYFMHANQKTAQTFTSQDSLDVDKMSIKDAGFNKYLNDKIKDSLVFTVQEKCARIIDSSLVNKKFEQLSEQRKFAFMDEFRNKGVVKQVKFSHPQDFVPYNGFSFYKIEYKGDFPEDLLKAYKEMDEYDNEAPREKFKKERKRFWKIF